MKTICILSKDNLKLAKAEFRAVMGKSFDIDENVIICNCDKKDIEKAKKRLAYSNSIFRLLISCPPEDMEKMIRDFSWQDVYEESYVVRKINCHQIKDEKYYGSLIWPLLKNPKVDLKNAKTEIFIICAKKAYVGILIGKTDKSYLQRASAMKPSLHPTAINPKLAKAMVNLTRAEQNDTIIDPFCGTGGILVEAGLMGLKTVGLDISEKMLKFAEKNLEGYKVKNWKLASQDATRANIKADYIVTDLPYGKNSRITGKLEKLYRDFLMNIKKQGIKKAVIGFPSFTDCKRIIKKAGFSIEEEFEHYLHKSLTKRIVVIK